MSTDSSFSNPFPAQVSPVPFSGSGARVFAEIPHPIKSLNLKVLLLIYCKLKAMPFRWSRCCCCSLWCGALGFSMFLLLSRPANRKATTRWTLRRLCDQVSESGLSGCGLWVRWKLIRINSADFEGMKGGGLSSTLWRRLQGEYGALTVNVDQCKQLAHMKKWYVND